MSIDVDRNSGDAIPGPMFYTTYAEGATSSEQLADEDGDGKPDGVQHPTGLWQPGDSHSAEMNLNNSGTMSVRIARVGAEITGDSDFRADAAAVSEFSQYMQVKVERLSNTAVTVYDGPLSELLLPGGQPLNPPFTMAKNASNQHMRFTCTLSTEAGNAIQGKKPVVSFYIVAEQAKYKNP